MTTITEPGVHYDVSEDAYHADPCPAPALSSSLAALIIARSPLHAWTASRRLNPAWEPETSATFDVGRAAHRQVLGSGAPIAVIPPDLLSEDGGVRTKEAKAWVADARERGATPVKAAVAAEVEQMAAAIEAALDAVGARLDPADSEVSAFDRVDRVWRRARIDNAPSAGPLYDLKTTTDASPHAVRAAIERYGYDVQAQHYRDVWRGATGEKALRPFRFVFVEKEPPYGVQIVELGDDSLAIAARKLAHARAVWRRCLDAGDWPGYPAGVIHVELPDWAAARWLERESAEADLTRRQTLPGPPVAFEEAFQ